MDFNKIVPEYICKERDRPQGPLKPHATTETRNQLHNLWSYPHHSTTQLACKSPSTHWSIEHTA